MTPEEKSAKLINTFMELTPAEEEFEFPYAIQCAAICVNEIIEVLGDAGVYSFADQKVEQYWQNVLTSINNTKQ